VISTFRGRQDDASSMQMMMKLFFRLQGQELWEKTIGIIGLGAVGRQVAARLRPFGSHLIAYDPYQRAEVFQDLGVESVGLQTLLRQSDFVSLHAPITPETAGMFGTEQFTLMKSTAFFLNLARAALTDENALAKALCEKRIAGAALDVYAKEPPAVDHPLLQLDNVIALPHIGGNTAEVKIHQSRIAVPDIERVMRGEKPRHCANPEVWDQFELRV
jgi:autoinducer 2 (AI-2) kinase